MPKTQEIVIQLALDQNIHTVAIDEAAGRRIARLNGLSMTGSQFLVQRKVLNTTSSTRLFSPPLILVSVHPS
jgi:predicted nucleic acid-binding protein